MFILLFFIFSLTCLSPPPLSLSLSLLLLLLLLFCTRQIILPLFLFILRNLVRHCQLLKRICYHQEYSGLVSKTQHDVLLDTARYTGTKNRYDPKLPGKNRYGLLYRYPALIPNVKLLLVQFSCGRIWPADQLEIALQRYPQTECI